MKIIRLWAFISASIFMLNTQAETRNAAAESTWIPTVTNEIFGKYLIHQLPTGYISSPIKTAISPDGSAFSASYARVADTPVTWQEMVTVEAFKGYAANPKMTPRIFLDILATGKAKFCEKSFYDILGTEEIGKYMAATMVRGCGYVQSPAAGLTVGEAYYELYIAIAGENDMYVLSRFVKTPSFDPKTYSTQAATITELKKSLMPISICAKVINNKCAGI